MDQHCILYSYSTAHEVQLADAKMVCSMYTVTNGCGHSATTRYRNCGRHPDTSEYNSSCFTSSPIEERNRPISVCMGARFCNKGCKALTVGWKCCTCGFKEVHGYYDTVLRMVVHESISGHIHAFCIMCRDINTNLVEDNHESTHETINVSMNTNSPITPSLSYDSDTSGYESEDLFYDASPMPIENDDEDRYEDHNSCAIKGKDLDSIGRLLENTKMSVMPIATPTTPTYLSMDEMMYEMMTSANISTPSRTRARTGARTG